VYLGDLGNIACSVVKVKKRKGAHVQIEVTMAAMKPNLPAIMNNELHVADASHVSITDVSNINTDVSNINYPTSAVEGHVSPVRHCYELNKEKSLTKMYDAATRHELLTIQPTGGGAYFSLQAGLYQIVKSTIHGFFQNQPDLGKAVFKDQTDSKGICVQTNIQVLSGRAKQLRYTINLYHTKCTMLVNGKQEDMFLNTVFPEFVNYISEHENLLPDPKIGRAHV
jgi:hypothetical protein